MSLEVIPNSPELKVSNLDAMPRGRGIRYLEVIRDHSGGLIAKQWRRKLPASGVVVDTEPNGPRIRKGKDDFKGAIIVDAMSPKKPLDPMYWLNYLRIQFGYGVENFTDVMTCATEDTECLTAIRAEIVLAERGEFGDIVKADWYKAVAEYIKVKS
jgi:hypothetical protein